MKRITILLFLSLILLLSSCSSGIRVVSDFDKEVNFTGYSSYAFYKPSIDKVKVSDLDKRRILRAIDQELSKKGMTKSDNPDIIIGLYTKEQERVDVYQNYHGYSWGWYPYYDPFGPRSSITQTTEGTLFIDLLDAKSKNLIWQGIGYSDLDGKDMEKKEVRIKEIVSKILEAYPPAVK